MAKPLCVQVIRLLEEAKKYTVKPAGRNASAINILVSDRKVVQICKPYSAKLYHMRLAHSPTELGIDATFWRKAPRKSWPFRYTGFQHRRDLRQALAGAAAQFQRTESRGLAAQKPFHLDRAQIFPDEVDDSVILREGATHQVLVNSYERDPEARRLCINHHGNNCIICNFSFGTIYGKVADGFIHVHHLRQLSTIRKEYVVNPIKDLRPVCPNCHAVLHRRNPAYSVEEVQSLLANH